MVVGKEVKGALCRCQYVLLQIIWKGSVRSCHLAGLIVAFRSCKLSVIEGGRSNRKRNQVKGRDVLIFVLH